MDEIVSIAVGTVTMRPYVFAFLAGYLLAAVPHLGWRITLLFMVVGYLAAFASEFSSIHTGFPYGWYYYLDGTKDRELWVLGVPFFDSLSYVFLSYCSYSTALLAISPVHAWRWGLVTLETRKIRKSFAVLFLGSLLQVYLDIIIDPVALQGYRWFLGQIYGYREQGLHFGVPISNYVGWWLTGACMIFILQRLDFLSGKRQQRPAGVREFPFRPLLGPLIYVSVVAFNLCIAFWIGEYLIGVTGLITMVLPAALVAVGIAIRKNRYSKEDLADHLADFPWVTNRFGGETQS